MPIIKTKMDIKDTIEHINEESKKEINPITIEMNNKYIFLDNLEELLNLISICKEKVMEIVKKYIESDI